MRRVGVRCAKSVASPLSGCPRSVALIAAVFAALMAVPQLADAACSVTTTGTVNCNADTATTQTTDIDGSDPLSSARTQRFHNSSAISSTVQPGVTVGGFGLHLIEKLGSKNTEQPITLNNQGRVTTSNGVNALQLTGDGGSISYSGDGTISNTNNNKEALFAHNMHGNASIAGDGGSISYSGDGTISNTNNNKAALFAHNMHGNASIAPGAGAISGATGINASTTGPGILTISTGSGLVTGTAADGIFATTGNGALNVTVGSGGVTSQGNAPAIDLTSVNGNITVTANGNVSSHSVLTFPHDKGTRGILATSNGRGNIVIDGSGTLFGQDRAIYALEGDTGLGGITITGTGDVFSASGSTIRAEIDNAADSSNIIVDRSGEIIGVSSGASIPGKAVSSSLHVITKGTGNIIVAGGADAAISHSLFGVAAVAFGRSSSGSIDVSTGADSTLQAGGTGIFAGNSAFHIPIHAFSTIAVTNNGTITSGALPNPVGRFPSEGGGAVATPAAILAGYDGRPVFEEYGSGRYTSCGVFGCTTLTPNPKVNGTVSVVNNGQINAAGGDGIFAFNFGNGNVSVTSISPITVTGATAQNGIEAFSAERGNISVTTSANVTTSNGNGIQATSAGSGGNIFIATGAGAISGTIGVNASTPGAGAVTITTGSDLVNGTAGQGILATTTNGAINVTVGSGGVTSTGFSEAINATSTNGNILITTDGSIIGGQQKLIGVAPPPAIKATSDGAGSIVVDGSGAVIGPGGHGIFATERTSALGGILVTGTGNTVGGGSICPGGHPTAAARLGETGCSGIRATITNRADLSNVIVNRSGNVTGTSTAINAITAGNGNIIVNTGVNALIRGIFEFGIEAGSLAAGSASISTGAGTSVTTDGTGILVRNLASAISAAADSSMVVTTEGTITSSATPVGGVVNPKNPTKVLAGISAAYVGGGSATPNPKVHGAITVVNNATINMAGGDGILALNFGNGNVSVTSTGPITVTGATAQNGIEAFSAEVGNISVSTAANVTTSNGNGIQTTSAGIGTTTINVLAGTTQGGTSGVSAASSSGAIEINNWATIQNLSGQPGSLAIATSGSGNATFINNAGGVVTGIVSMTGSGSNNFSNAGLWNTFGTSTFGDSSVNNTGIINIFGPTTFGGPTSLTNSGTLNLAAGSSIGTLTLPGNLAFQSGALYVVALSPPSSSVVNVGGTASLAGTVQGVLLPGAYAKGDTFTILQAGGGLGGTFSGFIDPGFSGTFTYTPSDALLTLTAAKLGAGGGLNVNQQNVATAIDNFFNSGGTLPPNFAPVFGLTGGNLGNALSQISGEVAADAEHGAFNIMTEFLNLMLDPFVEGRLGGGGGGVGGGQAIGFAPDELASLPPDVALAYAGVLKAPPPAPFEQRWTTWGTAYGGANVTNGNSGVGSSNLSAQTYGFAVGMDYHYSPDTIFGFALGGGGTDWGLASGGTGRSDAFQTGVYGITRSGPALPRRGARLRQSLDDHEPGRARRSTNGKLRRPELRRAAGRRLSLRRAADARGDTLCCPAGARLPCPKLQRNRSNRRRLRAVLRGDECDRRAHRAWLPLRRSNTGRQHAAHSTRKVRLGT